ncbi:25461_t:CDS:2 [Gigaspora margarita]|uniref:NADH dehydrogenase [ubiquinone] 1 beta subcomplex subunit 11, mitochondrial n=2 Tax=Gigaspora margarita TaxID=4874 RepID=A0A8H3X2G7_GIGMA|nr:NdufB11, NADH dehydrogenase 1 beta subcomplex subunit [Gigaspora margarita]CAG8773617.1 25461_t:CDS:2 [Gigaspora margarita]
MFAFKRTFGKVSRLRYQVVRLGKRRASGHSDHGHHEPEWNEPSGHLFGEKPLPPGQKRVKEDWENVWVYGMGGCFLLTTLIALYKPNTSIQSWALIEAQKKLDERGISLEYPHTERKW